MGYEVSDHNDNSLVFNTFKNAIDNNPDAHPLFHSDGGYQYTSPAFTNMLKGQGMKQSMSRVHCCINNGPMEGFWGIMKCEMYHYNKKDETKDKLIKAIDEWIYYYTYERYQRRFKVKTPHEIRSEALALEIPNQYPIPENKRIQKYKSEHYKSSTQIIAQRKIKLSPRQLHIRHFNYLTCLLDRVGSRHNTGFYCV